jgi:hypothetical protein
MDSVTGWNVAYSPSVIPSYLSLDPGQMLYAAVALTTCFWRPTSDDHIRFMEERTCLYSLRAHQHFRRQASDTEVDTGLSWSRLELCFHLDCLVIGRALYQSDPFQVSRVQVAIGWKSMPISTKSFTISRAAPNDRSSACQTHLTISRSASLFLSTSLV